MANKVLSNSLLCLALLQALPVLAADTQPVKPVPYPGPVMDSRPAPAKPADTPPNAKAPESENPAAKAAGDEETKPAKPATVTETTQATPPKPETSPESVKPAKLPAPAKPVQDKAATPAKPATEKATPKTTMAKPQARAVAVIPAPVAPAEKPGSTPAEQAALKTLMAPIVLPLPPMLDPLADIGPTEKRGVRADLANFVPVYPRISLTVYQQPLDLALNTMMGNNRYMLQDGADPQVKVSAEFRDLPIEEALNRLTSSLGYAWRQDKGTYIIYRDLEVTLNVDIPLLEQSFSMSSSRAGLAQSIGGAGTSTSGTSAGAVSGSNNSNVASATGRSASLDTLSTTLKEFLSKDGKLVVHKESGTVWLRDRAQIVQRVSGFIKDLNAKMTAPVRIQGIITEVTLNKGMETGVDWNAVIGGLSTGVQAASLVKNPLGTLGFTWNGGTDSLLVKALGTYGNVRVVSKPNIMVTNGAIGALTVGDTVSYVAQAYDTTATSGGGSSTSSLIVQPLQTGLSFFVLPRILNDQEAMLYIAPDLTTLQEIRTINSGSTTVEAPRITTKQAQTIVRVRKGERILIGGIMAEESRKQDEGVPLLKDVPGLGLLFKHQSTESRTTEFGVLLDVTW